MAGDFFVLTSFIAVPIFTYDLDIFFIGDIFPSFVICGGVHAVYW